MGPARYGNEDRNGLSFLSTPSPSGHLVALQEPGDDLELDVHDVVAEAAAVREAGGVAADDAEAVLRVGRRHAEVELERVDRRAVPSTPLCWFSPGMPWSSACTMSVRSFSGAPMSNSAFRTAASSGLTTYLP